jgi:hypothetical protein
MKQSGPLHTVPVPKDGVNPGYPVKKTMLIAFVPEG